MKIVMIHGQSHTGSSCMVARKTAEKIGGVVQEFFLPKDFNHHCLGCYTCFTPTLEKCPHYKDLSVIIEAIDHADVLILSSPVYVYHATGAMMDFLDHFGTWWVVHRIEKICVGVQATKLDEIPAAIRKQIEKKTDRVAERIVSHAGSIGINHRFQMWFYIVKLMHSLMPGDTPDYHWWENHGWHGDQRPWKPEI